MAKHCRDAIRSFAAPKVFASLRSSGKRNNCRIRFSNWYQNLISSVPPIKPEDPQHTIGLVKVSLISVAMTDEANLTLLRSPGILWQRTIEQTQHAIASGALVSIPTTHTWIEQDGALFLVRIVKNLIRKAEAQREQKQTEAKTGRLFDPFLPYDPDLFVVDVSKTHLCLLNKFNVADHHLLIVTRAFEEQEALLTLQDFEALRTCLAELNGLAFYNGGEAAGASQRHKHLQLVPLPFVEDGVRLPIDSLINPIVSQDSITVIPQFSFVHAFMRCDLLSKPEASCDRYHQLLKAIGIRTDQPMQSGAYNFLATQDWMLVVLRSQASYASIPVNSLAFSGALLVRNLEQLELLKQLQPLTLLKNVAVAIAPS